jgi:hypothetical protein
MHQPKASTTLANHAAQGTLVSSNFHAGRQSAPLMMKETMGVPSRWAEVVKTFDGIDRES